MHIHSVLADPLGKARPAQPAVGCSSKNGSDFECYTNSSILVTPQQTIANLGNLSVTGMANSGGLDTNIFSTGSTLYMVQNSDSELGLAGGWTAAEYNIVGDGDGSGIQIQQRIVDGRESAVDNGSATTAPSCVSRSMRATRQKRTTSISNPPPGLRDEARSPRWYGRKAAT